jgi:Domain of unknown function (DUF4864)
MAFEGLRKPLKTVAPNDQSGALMLKTTFSRMLQLLRMSLLGLPFLLADDVRSAPPSAAATAPHTLAARSLSTNDEKKIRKVVQGQLGALARDDAVKAFSFAAPNVRKAFVTAPRFLEMVQRGYPVVYRPASLAFLKVEGVNSRALQRVQMTDMEGEAWLATYSLERQKNGLWRITGCSVVENKGRMT